MEATCAERFEVRDVVTGTFSRCGATQKISLYSYCTDSAWFARDGIAIVEKQRVVAHFVYDGTSGDHALALVPDLDGDGLSEILVVAGGTGQGQTTGVAALPGWSPSGLKKLGMLAVYEEDCGTGRTKRAYRILAQPGPMPFFLREEYAGNCERGGWRRTRAPQPFVPRRDGIKYHSAP